MRLQQIENPLTGARYTVPTRMIRLTTPQQRVAATARVRGMHGVLDANTGIEDAMTATELTYQFLLSPREEGRTLDALKRDLYKAVAPGLPQRLFFRDDDLNIWVAEGAKATSYPVDVTPASVLHNMQQVTWRLNNPFLRLAHLQGDLVWADSNPDGSPVLWGQTSPPAIWGNSANSFLVTSGNFDVVFANPLGVVISADVQIGLGIAPGKNYGPTVPANPLQPGSDPNGIRFLNSSAVFFGQPTEFRILDALVAGDSYGINFPSKQAFKTTVGGVWRNLWRPANQRHWFVLVPGDNHINISVKGTALSNLQMYVSLVWYPRTIL